MKGVSNLKIYRVFHRVANIIIPLFFFFYVEFVEIATRLWIIDWAFEILSVSKNVKRKSDFNIRIARQTANKYYAW